MPDLKSSLNEVHLKIPHALKETSYLTDNPNMTGFRQNATSFGNYLFAQEQYSGGGVQIG
jgi:hypothetical protein